MSTSNPGRDRPGAVRARYQAKALPLYEQAFDIEYPLPKLDTLVANDFDAGAMENWVILCAFLAPR
jgi:aminopeptidase N